MEPAGRADDLEIFDAAHRSPLDHKARPSYGHGGGLCGSSPSIRSIPGPDAFRWQDGERVVRFGRGALADAPALLDAPYALLTTPRATALAPALVDGAQQ